MTANVVITLNGSPQQVLDAMTRFLGVPPPVQAQSIEAEAPETERPEGEWHDEDGTPVSVPPVAPKTRGRPRKYAADKVQAQIEQAKAQEEALQPKAEPAPAEETSKEVTLDSLRKALQEYQAVHGGGTEGMAKVAELLKGFGAKRISEVKKEDYQKIIDACKP